MRAERLWGTSARRSSTDWKIAFGPSTVLVVREPDSVCLLVDLVHDAS